MTTTDSYKAVYQNIASDWQSRPATMQYDTTEQFNMDSKPKCGARPQQSWLATIRQDQCQLYIDLNNVTVNSQPAVCYGGS